MPVAISVIMPVYKAASYLRAAAASVLGQTFSDLELILVVDGSPDDSSTIADAIAREDTRVQVLHNAQNTGAGKARNAGMALAKGEYITFVDADDEIDLTLYATVMQRLTASGADCAVWGLTEQYFDKNGELLRENTLLPQDKDLLTPEAVRCSILELEQVTLFGYQWNHLYRRSIIEQQGIRFEPMVLYEDFFFNLKFIRHACSQSQLAIAGYRYAKRPAGSITTRFVPEYFDLSVARVESLANACREWGLLDPKSSDILGRIFLRYSLSALARNCDARSGLDRAGRKAFVTRLAAHPLFQAFGRQARPTEYTLRVLRFGLDHDMNALVRLLGRLIYLVKREFVDLYARRTQIKRNS